MPQPAAVMLVSAVTGTGVDQLLIQMHREVGANGDVWVVRLLPAWQPAPCSQSPGA